MGSSKQFLKQILKRKSSLFILILLTLLFGTATTKAQSPPCIRRTFGYFYNYPTIPQFPILSTGMSYNALLGYVLADSLLRYGNLTETVNWSEDNEYSPTMKQFLKLYFDMVDWDPIHFINHKYYKPNVKPQFYARDIFRGIEKSVAAISEQKELDYFLMSSEYIARIRVENAPTMIDTSTNMYMEVMKVDARIVSPIKGMVLPDCIDEPQKTDKPKQSFTMGKPTTVGACLQFDYCPHWGDGNRIFEAGKEYFVFLDFGIYCTRNGVNYFGVQPVPHQDSRVPVFPINGDMVENPLGMFGFADSLSISEFQTKITNRIQQIKNTTTTGVETDRKLHNSINNRILLSKDNR